MTLQAPEWLRSRTENPEIEEDCFSYLMGRGAKTETLRDLKVFTFIPDDRPLIGAERVFGDYGERIEGWICFPVFSPTGQLIGVEARDPHKKQILKHFLPRSQWNPIWVTKPDSIERLYRGETAWLVEGVFDLFALEWAISEPVFATLRASVTRRHAQYLQRYARGGVKVVYDNDTVGQNAVTGDKDKKGVIAFLRQHGVQASAVQYVGGKDPGEIWLNGGATAIQKTFSLWSGS